MLPLDCFKNLGLLGTFEAPMLYGNGTVDWTKDIPGRHVDVSDWWVLGLVWKCDLVDECVSELACHQGAELGRYIYLLELSPRTSTSCGSLVMRDLCGCGGPPSLRGWLGK